MGKLILLRIQAKDGQKRIQVESSAQTAVLFDKVQQAFGYSSTAFELGRLNENPIGSSMLITVEQSNLNHGDLIYLTPEPGVVLTYKEEPMDEEMPSTSESAHSKPSNSATSISSSNAALPLVEDEVDGILRTQDGLIQRPRDAIMCKHGDNGSCIFCAPMEPYDETYLKENNIKHLSFHSYLKKLTGGVDKGKFADLEDLSVRMKDGCTTHLPWPKGICSKCQPSAVTLNRQIYRHVDNISFENRGIVDRFLSYWRLSGHQRMGFMYGDYEPHNDVPLGIKGRVVAIYEPPQESSPNYIRLNFNDEKEATVNEIVTALGLKCLGWVFTDLIPEDKGKGPVKHVRGIHSHFLSAQECITAARFQSLYPNPCPKSPTGAFGSKFSTVLITGDEKNQIDMFGYQVSNQCMALVRGECLLPTRDAPELGYVKKSSEKQYVPDVFYKEKDEYKNEVPRLARPLPVEYLLVDVPVATPIEQKYSLQVQEGVKPFPVANRSVQGQIQDFPALVKYLGQFDEHTPFISIARDFHFLLYLASMEIVPMREYIGPLLEAVRYNQPDNANDWAKSEHWQTVLSLVEASSPR